MLKKIWNHKLRFLGGLSVVLMFVLIRFFEKNLFYDPFDPYFKNEFTSLPLPAFNWFQLILGFLARYILNSLLSLGLLYFIFKEKEMICFVSYIYLLFFVVLIIAFFSILLVYGSQNPMLLFYVRRFLIQPIFVLLFIPALWFQKLKRNL